MKIKICILVFIVFTLVACSDSQEILMKDIEDNQKEVTYVHVETEEDNGHVIHMIKDDLNFKENMFASEIVDLDVDVYKDGDNYFVDSGTGVFPFPHDKLGTMRASVDRRLVFYQNPFAFFRAYDDTFTDHLEMEEEEDRYVFVYEPEEDIKEQFYREFIMEFLVDAQNENEDNDPLEQMNIDLDQFVLTIEVDASSKRITGMFTHEVATLELQGTEISLDRKTTYSFSNYNDEVAIQIPDSAIDITKNIDFGY